MMMQAGISTGLHVNRAPDRAFNRIQVPRGKIIPRQTNREIL